MTRRKSRGEQDEGEGAERSGLKYGEARERLERLLDELESDDVDLDDLAEKVREAAGLIRVLHDKLTRTSAEVQKVMEEVKRAAPGLERDLEGEEGDPPDEDDEDDEEQEADEGVGAS